jgi:hypothetical protein
LNVISISELKVVGALEDRILSKHRSSTIVYRNTLELQWWPSLLI